MFRSADSDETGGQRNKEIVEKREELEETKKRQKEKEGAEEESENGSQNESRTGGTDDAPGKNAESDGTGENDGEQREADTGKTNGENGAKNPVNAKDAAVENLLEKLSLHEKICQMMLVAPEELTGVANATAAGQQTKEGLTQNPVGGIIFFGNNLISAEQTTEMIGYMVE